MKEPKPLIDSKADHAQLYFYQRTPREAAMLQIQIGANCLGLQITRSRAKKLADALLKFAAITPPDSGTEAK